MDDRLKLLGEKVRLAHEAYVAARREETEAMIEEHPLKVGMRVRSKNGKLAEVVKFARPYSELQVYVRLVLKGGELGKDVRQAYSWDAWHPAAPKNNPLNSTP